MVFVRKIVVFILVLYFSLGNFGGLYVFSYNEQCDVCSKPPKEFSYYLDFVKEVLSSIYTTVPRGEKLGESTRPGAFKAGVYQLKDEDYSAISNISKNFVSNVNQTIWTLGATAAILFSIGKEIVWKDSWGGFWVILTKSRPFVMAWKDLLDIDTLIHDKMFELGEAGTWITPLNDENRAVIEGIFKKYTKEPYFLFQDSSSVDIGLKYRDIMYILLRLNDKMKRFILGSARDYGHLVDEVTVNGSMLKITMSAAQSLSDQYSCAQGINSCNASFKKFVDSVKKSGTDMADGAKEATTLIKKSIEKLKVAFSAYAKSAVQEDNPELTAQEKKLLEEQSRLIENLYGVETKSLGERILLKQRLKDAYDDSKFSIAFEEMNDARKKVIEEYFNNGNNENSANGANANIEKTIKGLLSLYKEVEYIQKANNDIKQEFSRSFRKAVLECLDNNKIAFRELMDRIKQLDPPIDKDKYKTCEQIYQLQNNLDMGTFDEGVAEEIENNTSDVDLLGSDEESIIASSINNSENLNIKHIKQNLGYVVADFSDAMRSATISSNQDMTVFVKELDNQVRTVLEIIGNKEENLIAELGEACTAQCENKGGLCYYD